MKHATVQCEQCGSEAKLIATEGALGFNSPEAKAQVMQVIDCPHCGQREQPEKPKAH